MPLLTVLGGQNRVCSCLQTHPQTAPCLQTNGHTIGPACLQFAFLFAAICKHWEKTKKACFVRVFPWYALSTLLMFAVCRNSKWLLKTLACSWVCCPSVEGMDKSANMQTCPLENGPAEKESQWAHYRGPTQEDQQGAAAQREEP